MFNNDVFRPMPQASYTEGAEEPFEALDIDESPDLYSTLQITATDYGTFVLEALAIMKRGKQRRRASEGASPSTPAAQSEPQSVGPSSSSSADSPPQRKRKRGEDVPVTLPLASSSSPLTSSSNRQPTSSSSTSTATPRPSNASSTSSQPAASSSSSGSSIDQDILRQALRLASSFLLTDATLNPELGLETWAIGLGRLVDIVLALHHTGALELETMRVASAALRECWVAGGSFPGLEDSRIRIREDGQKLKTLLDDPNRNLYKGQCF